MPVTVLPVFISSLPVDRLLLKATVGCDLSTGARSPEGDQDPPPEGAPAPHPLHLTPSPALAPGRPPPRPPECRRAGAQRSAGQRAVRGRGQPDHHPKLREDLLNPLTPDHPLTSEPPVCVCVTCVCVTCVCNLCMCV